MTDMFPVYAHRDSAGFAFVSFGQDDDNDRYHEVQYDGMGSGTEHVESIMFDAFPDEFWGPSPSEASAMSDEAVRDTGTLPVEEERGDVLYQVGEVVVDEHGFIEDVRPFEEVTEVSE